MLMEYNRTQADALMQQISDASHLQHKVRIGSVNIFSGIATTSLRRINIVKSSRQGSDGFMIKVESHCKVFLERRVKTSMDVLMVYITFGVTV